MTDEKSNSEAAKHFSHLDSEGRARMVDVGGKPATERIARAGASIQMSREAFRLLMDKKIPKGDVLGVARVAGIMAAKQATQLIPMCHPLILDHVAINFDLDEKEYRINIEAAVRSSGKTGVEMEALTACAIAALTIYDMCKAVDKTMLISRLRLLEKRGGKSGVFIRA